MFKMHRFLKILIFITVLWTITLPWTLNYLGTLTTLPDNEFKIASYIRNSTFYENDDKVVIGVVACGEKSVGETIVLLKSVILSSIFHGLQALDAILFADDEHLFALDIMVGQLKNHTKRLNFRYEIHPVIFPMKNHDEWKVLFKPCASQRLFLHTALPHIDRILYLDVDTVVVGNLRDVWNIFKDMSSKQAVALTAEHEISSIGWYNRFALHPFFPPLGLNTGVMLMNLTKIRNDLQWDDTILKAYKKYKDKIVYGDQDLINIIFYDRPDAVFLLPCSFNYRPDHCQYGWNCKSAEKKKGIQILHGNRNVFHNETLRPIFRKMYKYFEQFNMESGNYVNDLIVPFKQNAKQYAAERIITSVTINCDNIGKLFFKFLFV